MKIQTKLARAGATIAIVSVVITAAVMTLGAIAAMDDPNPAASLLAWCLAAGIVAFVVVGVVVGLQTYWLVRRFTAPIDALQTAVARIAAGDSAARAAIRTGDEFEELGAAFDRMLDDRISRRSEAERQNELLNESVIGLLQAVHQIAQRDLTAKAPVTEDIIGAIGDAINQLAAETAGVLANVNETAAVVEQASREVKLQSDHVSRVAEEERRGLEKMVTVLSRASESMQRVALLAYNSNKVAVQAGRTTDNALSRVASTLAGMGAIRTTITDLERRIKRLGERSHEIGQIVNVINTISERTHVLALNASMQAAVAGEAGRGFAVVAEEVQRLADSARQATERIERVIYSIQGETADAIAAVAKTIDRVTEQVDAAGETGARMQETREITGKLVEMVGRISATAEEHMAIATDLRAGIDGIDHGNRKSAEQLVAQNAVTAGLLASAERLVRAVRVFKLPAAVRG